jgi:serine phosphatase RsbU (regulator of sigma subunit)/anti-sigma regulatory factor (Ser/Thr protein kinase)
MSAPIAPAHASEVEASSATNAPSSANEVETPVDARRAILPIRWILPIASVILMALVAVGVAVVGERGARRTLTDELVRRLTAQSTNVALTSASAMLTPYPELTLHPVLLNLREHAPELALATVCDRTGTIVGDSDPRRLGQKFTLPAGLVARPIADQTSPGTVSESAALIVASIPVMHPNGTPMGAAYLGLRRGYIEDSIQQARRPVVFLSFVLLAIGVLCAFLLTSSMLRPIAVLQSGLERIGRGDLDTRLDLDARTEFGQLARTVNRMVADLKAGRRREIDRERLAHEIQLARRIQRSLLPTGSTVDRWSEAAGVQRSAEEVGGDYYETFRLADGRLGIVVADVAGKGLGGCLVTSMLTALLMALRDSFRSPAALLAALDRTLSKRLDRGVFVTMFLAFFDPRTGRLVYASAGHHPALLLHADGGQEWLEPRGLPIGADRKRGIRATVVDHEVTLRPDDLLIQTTDGIHEATGGPAGEEFGFERVAAALRGAPTRDVQHAIDTLSNAVDAWRHGAAAADDETIVALHWRGIADADVPAPLEDPVECVADARARGSELRLPPTLDGMVRIEDWLDQQPHFSSLHPYERAKVVLVLNEVCSNIVEHGGAGATEEPIQVWWVPALGAPTPSGSEVGPGRFVILDHGKPFSADNHPRSDYADPAVRRRGRGFGIDLVRRAARGLAYHPGTAIGNITLVDIEPGVPAAQGEAA